MTATVQPLTPPAGSDVNFGAVIDNIDLENLTGMILLSLPSLLSTSNEEKLINLQMKPSPQSTLPCTITK